ncbi:MAG: ATP-binding protein [Oligoflexia bacterium]|nr:ATP-binding protein [Oligoflexia bacterium]
MKLRFSIRYKILSVVTVLLVGALGLYLLLATRIFESDKKALVFDLNKSVVTTLAAEVETSLLGAADKLKLYALIFAGNLERRTQTAFQEIVEKDPLLVRLELYELGFSKNMKRISQITDKSFAELYKVDEKYYDEILPAIREIPFDLIQSKSLAVWNATIPQGPALIGMGISVIREGSSGTPEKLMAVVGYVKADQFLKNLKTSTLTQAFIIGADGRVLIHAKPTYMSEARDFSKSPIVNEFRRGSFSTGVMEYSDQGKEQLGAYSRVSVGGLGIISQVESARAFMAVKQLITRSLLFALIITTVTFIATIFFSRTLTQPLQKLMEAMEKVSAGNLDAALQIKSHDEIAVLSNSFNRMTLDLKSSRVQLEEINRELENKVIDRTKKLEEQNHAVKEAQEALLRTTRLASVGEIAGRTAHEVLNPLTSLMTRIQKVQKRLNDEVLTHKDLLGQIVKAWQEEIQEKGFEGFLRSLQEPSSIDPKMTLMQEDLHNITQIFKHWDDDMGTLEKDTNFLMQQAGRIEKILKQMRSLSAVSSSRAKMKIHPILHDAVNIVADLFAKNKIQVIEKYNASIDSSNIDRDELIQVLTNLMRNALYAVAELKDPTKKGFVRIETFNDGNKLCIDISDNGIGISKENQIKLFESQFSTKSPELGTGLGLSISRRFVRAFHGDLYLVHSDSNAETKFRIELPLSQNTQREVAA